jgi:BlaI family penicillinase repressor
MKLRPRISEAEWEIMKVIWSKAPISASEIFQTLMTRDPSWHPKTVKTYLTRLVSKQVLAFRKEGRAYVYTPLLTEKECVGAATKRFLNRVFGGSLKPMLAHFVGSQKLSPKEIEELKRILDGGGEA